MQETAAEDPGSELECLRGTCVGETKCDLDSKLLSDENGQYQLTILTKLFVRYYVEGKLN
jgi:hypothetical protein